MSDAQRTYYEVLSVGEDAPDEAISAARRRLLKVVHPDLARDEADRLHREQVARIVNDICDTLLDPIRRHDYDLRLERARRWSDSGGPIPTDLRSTDDGMPGEVDQDGPWLDESEWFVDTASGVHPIVGRMPALAPLEPWLTLPVAALAMVMIGVATVIYTTVGVQALASIGLGVGRFGSVAVVLGLALVFVVVCLGAMHMARAIRDRVGPDRG